MPTTNKKILNLKNELIKLIQAKQFKKAEKLYASYKDKNIQDADIWKYFAGIHSERKNTTEVINCCEKVLEINPNDSNIIYSLAASLQNQNRLDEAILQYEKCIAIDPNHIIATENCAHLCLLKGVADKSAIYYRRTLEKTDTPAIRLQYGQALMNSGDKDNALIQLNHVLTIDQCNKKALFLTAQCYNEQRNYSESEKYYLKLLQTDKNSINVMNNLGRVYEEAGKLDKAIELFRQAIDIKKNNEILYINLGKVLIKTSNFSEAKVAFDFAMKINPEHPEIYLFLGEIYNENDEMAKAKECFSKALDLDIHKYLEKPIEFIQTVKFFLSSIEDPENFTEDKQIIVANLFDSYADNFDEHLVNGLQYKTPELIRDLINKYVKNNDNNALDLGCGTGLCGQYLKAVSKNIVGVDLSSKMIDKAKLLGYYDQLIVGELTEVTNKLNGDFNLIVAADVFGYIGSLNDVFLACTNKMKKNGYYIFSIELLTESIKEDFKLYGSGRYKHSIEYINKLSSQHGFKLLNNQHCTLRKETNKDVKGCIITLIKI